MVSAFLHRFIQEETRRKQAACVLLQNGEKFLGVTRRYTINDWGLPGGKVDPGETPQQAAIREVREETGLKITNLRLLETSIDRNYEISLFSADYEGEIEPERFCLVDWIDPKLLKEGTFGDYNRRVLSTYKNV